MRFPVLAVLPLALLAMFSAAPASAEDAQVAAVRAVIQHHVAALNSGDPDAIAADWAPEGALVDAFPPYLWQGKAPERRWWSDLQEAIKPAGFDKVTFSTEQWTRLDVRGDRAYVVVNATALISGTAMTVRATGTWTFVLNRLNGTWQISGWNWGGPQAVPVKRG